MQKSLKSEKAFRINKKLGQNFLFCKRLLKKIVEICPINSNTIIIEIGSGYGSLTNLLGDTNCQRVISYEKDERLFQWLEKNNKNKKIVYFNSDVLSVDWQKVCSPYKNASIIIVGNLPYYLANSLIVRLLKNSYLFESLVFLIQKEVGQKWIANSSLHPSKYSALSVFIGYLAKVKICFEIPHHFFSPPPLVDGVVVTVSPYKCLNLSSNRLSSFLRFLKHCFRFRRKTLWNNLHNFSKTREGMKWNKFFLEKNYSTKIRPQELSYLSYWELFIYWENYQ